MSKRRQNWMHKASTAFGAYIRQRDGQCLAAGVDHLDCKGHLQCCHIVGRGDLALRVDEDNAITMCQAHHMYYTPRIAAWHDLIDELYPGRWDELRRRSRDHLQSRQKMDWEAEYAKWAALV